MPRVCSVFVQQQQQQHRHFFASFAATMHVLLLLLLLCFCAHALNTLTYDRSCFMRYILLVLFFLIKSTRVRLVLLIEKSTRKIYLIKHSRPYVNAYLTDFRHKTDIIKNRFYSFQFHICSTSRSPGSFMGVILLKIAKKKNNFTSSISRTLADRWS